MKLDGILFLAAFTARSQAYAQALAHRGLDPEHVLTFGPESLDSRRKVATASSASKGSEIFFPNHDDTLLATCQKRGWNPKHVREKDVNDPAIAEQFLELKPKAVIFSGYDAQIVKPSLLGLGIPIIHCHSGWLPDYRGSTTIYYSILQERGCAVTAFLLDDGIDTGPILARRRYPPPPRGIDIDSLYDNALRADLLGRLMIEYASTGKLPEAADQEESAGSEYYIIHPVLKHLSILSLERQ